ncbi:MAG: glycosyltransferase family 39 protein [Planctomycetota bacterium]|jgi:hypothetical protein
MTRRVLLAALAIVLVGLALRVHYAKGRDGFWRDEAQDWFIVEESGSYGELIGRLGVEGHPPLHYVIERFLHGHFGSSPDVVRYWNVLLGTLAIALVMRLAWRFGPGPALLAGGIMATSPFFIHYASEHRAYSLVAVVGILHAMALVRFVVRDDAKSAVLWGCSAALLAYTHVFGLYPIVAGGLFALARRPDRRNLGLCCLAGLVCLALFSPWLPSLMRQAGGDIVGWQVRKTDYSPVWTIADAPLGTVVARWIAAWSVLLGLFITLPSRCAAYDSADDAAPLHALLAAGVGGAFLARFVALSSGPWNARYLIPMAVTALPACTYYWGRLIGGRLPSASRSAYRMAGWALVAAVPFLQGYDAHRWMRDAGPAKEIAAVIDKHGRPDDLIWIAPAYFATGFNYHFKGTQRQLAPPYEGRVTIVDWKDLRDKTVDGVRRTDLIEELRKQLEAGKRVWLVANGELPFHLGWALYRDNSPEIFGAAYLLGPEWQFHRRTMRTLYRYGVPVQWRDWPIKANWEPLTMILFRPRRADEPLVLPS